MFAVSSDADDFYDAPPLFADLEALPNRIPLRPEAPRHRFVDDHDAWRIALILRREIASGDHRYAHRPKPIGSDDVVIRAQRTIGRGLLLPRDKDRIFERTPAERRHRRQARRLDSRQRGYALRQLLVKLAPIRFRVPLRF